MLRKLWEAVHKRSNSLHVFIFLKFMMPVWVRMLLKIDEFVVYVPPGEMFWPSSMHKSFVLGFIPPLNPHKPWMLRGTLKVLGLVRTVSLLLRESSGNAGSVLRQLWLLLKRVESMSGVLARGLLLI